MYFAAAILILSVFVLSLGAINTTRVVASDELQNSGTGLLALTVLGVLAACLSGIAYCVLSVATRYAAHQGSSLLCIMGIVSLCGFVALSGLTILRSGLEPIVEPNVRQYVAMFGAGVFNFMAFLALTKSLQLASVFFVNTLNASQSAMAAVAGILLFHEPITWALPSGLILTVIGLWVMTPKRKSNSTNLPTTAK